MAYDFVIGKSALVKDEPVIFGSIDFDDMPAVSRIAKNHKNWFFEGLQDIFDDRTYCISELQEAAQFIDQAILSETHKDDLSMLYKFSAMVSMAIRMHYPLHGLAD
ncbi:hypothetical protein [Persicirhabdus sediminis]|uniref:Uncharacterized protein n=1 Tax=Persicirhabdus sediminis TaxID=454144 RepID=A0A8J7SKB9_9BACT|nr:hypothetical protein [Persicirhabdus sediminis]MBK1791636.1 hypothetical protein [Persicirhabdus sediminis]